MAEEEKMKVFGIVGRFVIKFGRVLLVINVSRNVACKGFGAYPFTVKNFSHNNLHSAACGDPNIVDKFAVEAKFPREAIDFIANCFTLFF